MEISRKIPEILFPRFIVVKFNHRTTQIPLLLSVVIAWSFSSSMKSMWVNFINLKAIRWWCDERWESARGWSGMARLKSSEDDGTYEFELIFKDNLWLAMKFIRWFSTLDFFFLQRSLSRWAAAAAARERTRKLKRTLSESTSVSVKCSPQ